MDQMSIGEFARRSRLSAKALRLYDELGLLPPARVDEDSGYRFYGAGQLKQARLIAALRQLQIEGCDEAGAHCRATRRCRFVPSCLPPSVPEM